MNLQLRIFALASAILACLGAADDQLPKPPAPDLNVLARSSKDYRLGGGDLIEISVYGVQSYSHKVRVAASGLIRLPLIGEISVEGKTAGELERELEGLLREGVIWEPTVSVYTVEHKSRMLFVLGAVRQPGQFQIIKQLRVVDVLTMAGGLADNAGDELLIQRQELNGVIAATKPGEPNNIRIDLKELLSGGDLSLNITVEDGDIITIPEKIVHHYYVVGEINSAGAFVLPEETSLLASQALARAGGAMKTAKLKKAVLIRFSEAEEREQLPLNFAAIFDGKDPDLNLRPNDIIFVPGSKFKTFGYAMLQVLPTTLTRATIWF